ncbi:MAG: glycoside hydrolase family 3 protein [Acidimicrobiales bacterium]|nr:glycoside hydrolase family 3 protein [Acidimicrobiales bacterium]
MDTPALPRPRFGALVLLFVLAVGAVPACGSSESGTAPTTSLEPTTAPATLAPSTLAPTTLPPTSLPPTTTIDPANARIDELIATLPLDEKVGQLIMTVVLEGSLSDADRLALSEAHLGGVFFTSTNRNVVSVEQSQAFIADLQSTAGRIGHLIATDQEGRLVGRYDPPSVELPQNASAWAAAYADDPEAALAGYIAEQQRAAADLCTAGINVNFAPDVDVDTSGSGVLRNRTFGADPSTTTAFARAAVEAYRDTGVAPTAKHFPGHGATAADSHQTLPVIELPRAEWEATHLPPFAAAIEADMPIIMVGHLAYLDLDPSGRPASLSPVIITELLRDELGYDGVVVTDDLGTMRAVRDVPADERVMQTIEAGADIALVASGTDDAVSAANALVAAASDGRLSEQDIDNALRRVLHLKTTLGLVDGALELADGTPTCGVAE